MQRLFRAALAVLAVTTIIASTACNDASIDTPTTSSEPTAPVASAPTPAASPTPTPSAGEGQDVPAWEVSCSAVGQMTVKYNGEASHAEVLTYYTSFDGPQQFGEETKILPTGEQWTRTFPACSQSDAEPTSGKPAGHCFFDKNGVPFNEKRNPEKVTECRTTPCKPEWRRSEEYEVIYGPWSGPGESSAQSFTAQAEEQYSCGTRTVTFRYTETNSCTRETRTVDVPQKNEDKKCEVPCEQQNPPRASISGPSYPPYTPAVPPTVLTGDNARSAFCSAKGGSWLNDYNVPDDNNDCETGEQDHSGSTCPNVCRTSTSTNINESNISSSDRYDEDDNSWRYFDLSDLDSYQTSPGSAASGGNPISGSATFYNAGSWEVRLLSASSVSEYNSNNPDYVKDSKEATVTCGSNTSRSVSYNWVGHGSEVWWVEVRLNGNFHSKSSYVTNPTN